MIPLLCITAHMTHIHDCAFDTDVHEALAYPDEITVILPKYISFSELYSLCSDTVSTVFKRNIKGGEQINYIVSQACVLSVLASNICLLLSISYDVVALASKSLKPYANH